MSRRSLVLSCAIFLAAIIASGWWFVRSKRNAARSAIIASEMRPPELSFCQLVADPTHYDGWVVRVHAVYSWGVHGSAIGDDNCSNVDNTTWVNLSPAMRDEMSRVTDDAYGMKHVSGPLRIIARGRFAKNNPTGRGDSFEETAPFRFELVSIETAVRADKL
jgi:hypothetical protein